MKRKKTTNFYTFWRGLFNANTIVYMLHDEKFPNTSSSDRNYVERAFFFPFLCNNKNVV